MKRWHNPKAHSHNSRVYYGWIIVAVSFFVAMVTVGSRNAAGVFVIPMSEYFEWNRTTISAAFFVSTLVSGLSQPFMGRLYDVLGGRKVVIGSLIVLGISTILLSLTFNIVFMMIIYGLVLSIAMSGASINTTSALLSRWFQEKRATVLGLSTAGASVGGLLLVPFAAYLLDLTNWQITWLALGIVILVLALPMAFFLKDDPSEVGLAPDGLPRQGANATRIRNRGPAPLEADDWQAALRSNPLWQLSAGYFVCGFTTNILSYHFVAFAEGEGYSRTIAATTFGLMSSLNVVGVILVGLIADKLGRKNLLAGVYGLRGIAYVTLLTLPGSWSIWVFACIAGFSWIATAPLTLSLTADIYGLRNLGTLSGLSFLAHQVGGSISVLLAGIAYDTTGSYDAPFIACAVLLLFASVTIYCISEKKYSSRYTHLRPVKTAPVNM